ncbi:hypothetical protein H5410_056109 [Solanum commersonii]|uniref:Uncharacterized protein n=1 Tax=Solanum commersonii TaxID=4109 RepID=A0A9J5WL56_SOLCO|nr:hypothetical protein H5410_056109 [Solanum commersonii]
MPMEMKYGLLFSTSVQGISIHLVTEDISRILHVLNEGWDHYVKFEWPPLDNMASALDIFRKFLGRPSLTQHGRVIKLREKCLP